MENGESYLLWYHSGCILLLFILLAIKSRSTGDSSDNLKGESVEDVSEFKRRYLIPYVLATFTDWIQGPYQFKVYLEYELTEADIGLLYVAGFGSSLVCGTFTASLADRIGRRNGCLLYCLICSMSCLTKNSPNFHILLLGRAFGGVAASLLFAAFESWCVSEAQRQGIPKVSLTAVFTSASILNGLTAIVASLVGHALVVYTGSFIAPFNLVPVVLIINAMLILWTWEENYGEDFEQHDIESPDLKKHLTKLNSNILTPLMDGVRSITSEPRLSLLGLIASLFDASIYIFIFLWTLSLERRSASPKDIPHGLVFALFMGWSMVGALGCEVSFSSLRTRYPPTQTAAILLGALLWAGGIGLLPGLFPWSSFHVVFNGYCLLELAFGAYTPCQSVLRAHLLKDSSRTAATALYRVPTNVGVILVLYFAGSLTEATETGLCLSLILIAIVSHYQFMKLLKKEDCEESSSSPPEQYIIANNSFNKMNNNNNNNNNEIIPSYQHAKHRMPSSHIKEEEDN